MFVLRTRSLMLLILGLLHLGAYGAPLDAGAYTLEERDKVTDMSSVTSWLGVLHLYAPDIRIPLMPEESPADTGKAIDRNALRVEWLQSERILWVSWLTVPCSGPGEYVFGCDVLVDLSTKFEKEIYRHAYVAGTRHGDINRTAVEVNFVYDGVGEQDDIRIKRHTAYSFSHTGFKEAAPLAVALRDGGILRQVQLVEEVICHYSPTVGVFSEGNTQSWIKFSALPLFGMEVPEYAEKQVTLAELTDFFARMQRNPAYLTGIPKYGANPGEKAGENPIPAVSKCDPDTEARMVSLIAQANPGIETWPVINGLVNLPYGVTPWEFTQGYVLPEGPKCAMANLFWEAESQPTARWLDQASPDAVIAAGFRGYIGDGLNIGMALQFTGKSVAGTYWYEKYQKPLQVKGERTGEKIYLDEFDDTGSVSGHFSCAFENTVTLRGTWKSGDGTQTLPFSAAIWDTPQKEGGERKDEKPLCDTAHELVKREIPSKLPSYSHYQYELAFPNQKEVIPLGRLCEAKEDERFPNREGFDQESFVVKTVMDGLLQVNWATLPQGQGINSNWCTLLLNKTDRGWHPIFSDVIVQAVYRNNISDNSKVTLGFEASPGGGVALVEYAQLHRGQPNTQFGTISMCVRTEWPCVIEAGKVVLSPGRRYLRMDSPENVSIWKLAYFTGYFGSEEDVAELRKLNPSLHDSNVCGGVLLLLESVEPYTATAEGITRYNGNEEGYCPCEHGRE